MNRLQRVLWGILTAVLIGMLSGCPGPTVTKQPSLHVFNWTDYIGQTTVAGFEQSTGARVVYDNYSSNEELIAKLEAGGADYDVIFPSGYAVEILKQKNLLAPLDHSKIPNLKNVMTEFAAPSFDHRLEYCVPYTWSTTGIGYDARDVSDAQAKSFATLFDPKLRGKILLLDDMRATMGMALKSLGYSANTTNSAEIAQAKSKLQQQKPLVHVYTSSNIPQLLASGEVKLAYGWSGDILQAAGRNPNIRYSIPVEGTLIYVDYMCVPNTARNKELALRFINHILDPTVSAEIAETIHYATTNLPARELAKGETRELWNVLERSQGMSSFEFVRNLGSSLQTYDQAWEQLKAK
jgi:spermidine/putrescine transport system substrate-binding protein